MWIDVEGGGENQLLPLLESLADTSKVVDLQELLKRLAFNMLCKVKKWVGAGSEKRLKDAEEEVRAYVEGIIRDKKRKIDEDRENHGEENLLSRLLIAGNDEEAIRDMAISFIMADRDTTSAAMTWFFWLLSCDSVIEQELVKEINTMEKSLLNYESLKALKLLKACLCESMRLLSTSSLGLKACHGRRLIARWHSSQCRRQGNLSIVTDPRVRLGKEMAFIQMNYVVASILRQFEIKPFVSEKPVFVPLLTAHMAGGLKVVIQKRDDSR
ncbi:hypothetical protein F3Y22_tig00110783pilonHSYRG00170 [Hibiscus syriacus]|uniref:Uncharacterized protein n=1 Tax=Hibiscus syriacus TaxID=106335 RepID=A0A6A2ZR90_HIBSY|nr:hypothetical protein F3Y22_tig00110783pilonHSYRG00170 [Hibiscus syriacus]